MAWLRRWSRCGTRSRRSLPSVRLAFEFLLLTAARSSEVRVATLDEIDMGGGVSTAVAARMKAKH